VKITKKQLKQLIKEELNMLNEKYVPYTTGDLQKLLTYIGSSDYSVQIIVNGQTLEVDEVWDDSEERTLNISAR
jgi:hypothetical protein